MADKSWKKFERNCSRDMGVERQAVTGERDGADNAPHPMFAFQFKKRLMLPSWLWDWLGGIVQTGLRAEKIGVLVVKAPGMDDGDAIVMLRWRDWVDLHGREKFQDQPHRDAARASARTRYQNRKQAQPRDAGAAP